MISSNPPASLRDVGPRGRVTRFLGGLLDHLEEWLIATLIAVATAIVFVAVLHRYGTSSSIDFAKWLDAHGMAFASPPFRALFSWLAARDLSWAQELCIYLFIWMAKFGAAYGVRTGIHVGVDVLVMRMEPARAKKVILFGLLAGAFFTATIAYFGVHFTKGVWDSGSRSNDLEAPMWIIYMAIPAGSSLMCFRFLQVAWHFWRHGALPRHEPAHVDGVDALEHEDAPAAPVTLSQEAAAQPQRPRHHPELGRAVGRDRRRIGAAVELVEQRAAQLGVDGPPVVRVDQRVLPQLGALVDVRHARHRQLHELLAQCVRPAVGRDPVHERRQRRMHGRVVVGAVDRVVHRLLERFVRIDPGRALRGAADARRHFRPRLHPRRRLRRRHGIHAHLNGDRRPAAG